MLPAFLALLLAAILGKSNFNANDFKYAFLGSAPLRFLFFYLLLVIKKIIVFK